MGLRSSIFILEAFVYDTTHACATILRGHSGHFFWIWSFFLEKMMFIWKEISEGRIGILPNQLVR